MIPQVSDSELELMQIVWDHGGKALYAQIMEALAAAGRSWQKNTVITLLSRLVVKGMHYHVKIVPIAPKHFRSLGIAISEKRMHDKNIRRLISCSQSSISAKYANPVP